MIASPDWFTGVPGVKLGGGSGGGVVEQTKPPHASAGEGVRAIAVTATAALRKAKNEGELMEESRSKNRTRWSMGTSAAFRRLGRRKPTRFGETDRLGTCAAPCRQGDRGRAAPSCRAVMLGSGRRSPSAATDRLLSEADAA